MIKLLTIDLDDTLWDARPILLRAERSQHEWLATNASRITDNHTASDIQRRRVALVTAQPALRHDFTAVRRLVLEELAGLYDYPADLAAAAVEHFLEQRSTVELFADVAPAIARLRRRFRLVAMTNGNTDLRRAGLADWFEFVVSPAESGTAKPDTRMFDLVFDRAAVGPESVVHVGDQPYYDIEAAHRAEVASVWINRSGCDWPDDYQTPHAEISSLSELEEALNLIINRRGGLL